MLVVVIVVLMAIVQAGWLILRASLPELDGTQPAPLGAAVTIQRDALGVPTVEGLTRGDVAYASGFLHAQDRFFQMDLLRRVAAGEMGALIGAAALPLDRRDRPLRFRVYAQAALAALPADQRQLIERYTTGVNDGLRSLRARPFEYWLLRTQPAPWRAEDTLLVVYAMYFDLQYEQVRRVLSRAALRERVPADLLAFLLPRTSHWDAPLDGASGESGARSESGPAETVAVPASPPWLRAERSAMETEPDAGAQASTLLAGVPGFVGAGAVSSMIGSNSFAVDGAHGTQGGALVASDMHLGLSLPNIWYRISLVYPAPDGGTRRITGVSLPGAPLVVAGSNGHIAWAFTNSYGRFVDLIELQRDPATPQRYRVPGGAWETAQVIHERLDVKGGASVDLPVTQTRWGPQLVVGEHAYALHWVAQDPQAVNLNLVNLEGLKNVADAIHAAPTFGLPTQNFTVADAQAHIGWTLAGPLPHFVDPNASAAAFDGLPFSSDTYAGWQGYLSGDAYPVRLDPAVGRLWTANNRTLPLSEAVRIGDAGTDLGARATQIRNDLLALPRASERDLLAVQTDDRAVWIEYWRRVVLDALDARALDGHPERAEFRRLVEGWNGRADVDAVGYRLVRACYFSLYEAWFGALDKDLGAVAPELSYRAANTRNGATMEILASHHAWIPAGFADWRAFMLDRIDHSIAQLPKGTSLAQARWGAHNRSAIAHPFARMLPTWLPWVRGWLSAPADPLPGDINMPRVQLPAFGASERFVVSPGREKEGIFEMPGGQSGHPMSPYFIAGHEAWVHGAATPFLPGPTVHTLTLRAE